MSCEDSKISIADGTIRNADSSMTVEAMLEETDNGTPRTFPKRVVASADPPEFCGCPALKIGRPAVSTEF